MRTAAFRDWLDGKYAPGGAASRASEANRVEAAYGNLDTHFARDDLAFVLNELAYTAADEHSAKPNPSRIRINGNVRNGLASLKSAVRCYQDFASWAANGNRG